jgi:hypothetical protein
MEDEEDSPASGASVAPQPRVRTKATSILVLLTEQKKNCSKYYVNQYIINITQDKSKQSAFGESYGERRSCGLYFWQAINELF